MASGKDLKPNKETGWRRGFKQLLARENSSWWKTTRWLVQAAIFLVVINGLVAVILNTGGATTSLGMDKVESGIQIFLVMGSLAPVIAIVAIGQDSVISEKQSGTAAWILSKPVSRTAFILSKLLALSLGFFGTIAVIQGAVAYAQLSIKNGAPLPALNFAGGVLLMFLDFLFYITLTLMLGVLFEQRGGVIGIGLALAFGYQLFTGVAPWLMNFMPWGIVYSVGQTPSVAEAVMNGQTPASFLPVGATAVWCVLFTVVALWRFHRAEF
jgi:ABC-2 type transport system permease protein